MGEYMKLWAAKALVEVSIWLAGLAAICLVAGACYWWDQRKKRRPS